MSHKSFHRANHFIYRQWDRGVDSSTINAIERCIVPGDKEQTVIAFPWFLRNHGEKTGKCLVVIIKGGCFITTYWRRMEEILFNNFHADNIITLIK